MGEKKEWAHGECSDAAGAQKVTKRVVLDQFLCAQNAQESGNYGDKSKAIGMLVLATTQALVETLKCVIAMLALSGKENSMPPSCYWKKRTACCPPWFLFTSYCRCCNLQRHKVIGT